MHDQCTFKCSNMRCFQTTTPSLLLSKLPQELQTIDMDKLSIVQYINITLSTFIFQIHFCICTRVLGISKEIVTLFDEMLEPDVSWNVVVNDFAQKWLL